MSAYTCEIVDLTSTRHAALYWVRARGRVYQVRLEDLPGADDCVVHIDDLEEGPVYQAIEAAVLHDWRGLEPDLAELAARSKRRRLAQPSRGKLGHIRLT
jgi:hypothetical protein